MAKNHYIPRLLLRKFAEDGKVNSYDFVKGVFCTKKLKNTFAENDLFDPELEKAFADKLEGPIGDMLNNKLLAGDKIVLDRRENLLLRKFFMINALRAPITSESWEDMVDRVDRHDHPIVEMVENMKAVCPEMWASMMEDYSSDERYISDLRQAMSIESLEDIAVPKENTNVSDSLKASATTAMMRVIGFWDCEETGQEFIMPKLPGISVMDNGGLMYKASVMQSLGQNIGSILGQDYRSAECYREYMRLMMGSMMITDNFAMYPISPTRMLVAIAPYFRAFFPVVDPVSKRVMLPPLLGKEQFDKHFYKPMNMELFRPCENWRNKQYTYSVKKLTAEEVMQLNAGMLDMETEEMVFHDYNKIRDSFWYYDNVIAMGYEKKHDLSHMI